MKKYFFIPLTLSVMLSAQTLKTTLTQTLATNPSVQERLKNFQSTQEEVSVARAGYYPKLDLNLGAGHETTKRSNQAGGTSDQTYNFTVYQNSLKLTQNLFNGFSTTYQLQEAKYKTIAAAYSYIEKVNTTSYDLVSSYLELLKNTELIKTAKENVDIDEKILNKVQKLYNAGLTTLSEVNKIQSSLALARANLVVQKNRTQEAAYNLQKVVGRPLKAAQMSKPRFVNTALPKTLAEAQIVALKNNPSLLVNRFNIKLAQATKKKLYTNYYPKVDLEVSQSMNKNLSGIEGNNDAFRAMAYLSYNLFNGLSDKANITKSVVQIEQEEEKQNSIKRETLQSLQIAWTTTKKTQEQLKYLQQYHEFSKKTLSLYNKEYALGRRSLLDLLSSQNDLIHSKEQIITAQYSILSSQYKILNIMGTLVSTLMKDDTKNIYTNVNLQNNFNTAKVQ